MRKVLVIGYGNPLLGDDAFGWVAAKHLFEMPLTAYGDGKTEIDIQLTHQLTLEMAELISQAILVIFIDARYSDVPGQFVQDIIRPMPNAASTMPVKSTLTFSHHLDPQTLIDAACQLYGAAGRAVILSVSGASFRLAEVNDEYLARLSPCVEAAIPQVLTCVQSLIDELDVLEAA